jgi:hypothetical protein
VGERAWEGEDREGGERVRERAPSSSRLGRERAPAVRGGKNEVTRRVKP